MAKLRIIGGKPLEGSLTAAGAKNAALKMVAASLLGTQKIVLHNVPRIIDIDVMLELVNQFGVTQQWPADHTLVLDPSNAHPANPSPDLVKKLRASFVLVGPALARFGKISIAFPGGDQIGRRPVDTHLDALKQLGATINQDGDLYHLDYQPNSSVTIFLQEPSVTATENIILASTLGHYAVTIYGAASEPEIGNLIDLLTAMGAQIYGKNTASLTITGQSKLKGAESTIIPDRIETGTILMAGLITGGSVQVNHAIPGHSNYLIPRLKAMGAGVTSKNQSLAVDGRGKILQAISVDTRPYPGFYTDLQSPLAALCTQSNGTSVIFETMYENRFNYVSALQSMGASIKIDNPHRLIVTGPTPLRGQAVSTSDIRAGAALVLAGLAAQGETIVDNIELIDRGYERLDEKLRSIGAHIERLG